MYGVSMAIEVRNQVESKKMLWTGSGVSIVISLLLLMDAAMKILKTAPAVQGTIQIGYPESVIVGIGIALLISVVLYAIPQTAVLGAILLTGYLGGAVASNVRIGTPVFTYMLAPVYVAILVWGGLFLRDERLRALIPLRKGV
jgi:hypothetical protein